MSVFIHACHEHIFSGYDRKYYEVSKICSCGKDEHWVDVDGKIVVVFDHKHRSLSQVFVVWDMSAMKVLFKAYCCV